MMVVGSIVFIALASFTLIVPHLAAFRKRITEQLGETLAQIAMIWLYFTLSTWFALTLLF